MLVRGRAAAEVHSAHAQVHVYKPCRAKHTQTPRLQALNSLKQIERAVRTSLSRPLQRTEPCLLDPPRLALEVRRRRRVCAAAELPGAAGLARAPWGAGLARAALGAWKKSPLSAPRRRGAQGAADEGGGPRRGNERATQDSEARADGLESWKAMRSLRMNPMRVSVSTPMRRPSLLWFCCFPARERRRPS